MWGKFGCDDVELRAYCFKHSDLPNGGGAIQQGQQDFAIVSTLLPSIPSLHLNKPRGIVMKNGAHKEKKTNRTALGEIGNLKRESSRSFGAQLISSFKVQFD